ncbi:MAG: hypothetical protein SGILL_000170 [Bacillariaceae sp.]
MWASTTSISPTASLSKKSTSSSPSRLPSTASKRKLSSAGKTLLALNGFDSVPLPKSQDVLDLAEGVVIKPAPPKEIKSYALYAQPEALEQHEDDDRGRPKDPERGKREYPVFIEADHTLYRVVENQAAVFLDHQYSTMRTFFKVYIDEPSKRVAERVESSALYNLLVDQPKPAQEPEPSKPTQATDKPEDDDDDEIDDADDLIRHLTPSTSLQPGEEHESLEGLLVMSYEKDELTIYERMQTSTRIAALPNTMSHNSASTLVHVSLVVFGALPLAYRSYIFALNYGYAQSIAASVGLTIAYGIWSHRVSAKTNQSRVVNNALLKRVLARDDAVVSVLQEGAVTKLTRAILQEYYQQRSKSGNIDEMLINGYFPETGRPVSSLEEIHLINPGELAMKLGLLVSNKSKDGAEGFADAVPLDDALISLTSSTLSH